MEPLPLTSHCTGPAPCGSCGLAHCLEALGSCRITWLRACRKTATLPGRQKMEALEVCTSKRCHVACVACLACIACIACIACVRKRIPETEPSESPRRQTRALRALSLKERPTDKPRNLPESLHFALQSAGGPEAAAATSACFCAGSAGSAASAKAPAAAEHSSNGHCHSCHECHWCHQCPRDLAAETGSSEPRGSDWLRSTAAGRRQLMAAHGSSQSLPISCWPSNGTH